MPTASTAMIETVRENWKKLDKTAKEIKLLSDEIKEKSGSESDEQKQIDNVITLAVALDKQVNNLETKDADEKKYKAVRDMVTKTNRSAEKIKKRVDSELKSKGPDAWKRRVVSTKGKEVDLSSFNSTFQNFIQKIVQEKGNKDHGPVAGNKIPKKCLHWRLGDVRIFGYWNSSKNQFVFVGDGRHKGSTNSEYKVDLFAGGKTTCSCS